MVLLFCSVIFFLLAKTTSVQIYGVNAWFKPLKFAFSTCTYVWAMAWYCHYLRKFNITYFNTSIVLLLGFEIIYIAIQAGRGQLSHYNISNGFYSGMYALMALAATAVTLYTAYVCILFFKNPLPHLPSYYLWSIRLGLVLFVLFSFEGFIMGSRLYHSVGAVNDNSNMFIVGWSKTVGDLRIAHFIGMHALQILPILSYYILKRTNLTVAVSTLYACLAVWTLIHALRGKPMIKERNYIQSAHQLHNDVKKKSTHQINKD